MASTTRTYHHGGLRAALVEAGLKAARTGGAGALGLRELTRSVGVTPNAAYRHFADRQALVLAVAAETQDRLAQAMLDRMTTVRRAAHPAERAVQHLRGVGLGYIQFALSEPGWFELAILTQEQPRGDSPHLAVGDRVPPPYQLLLDTLDEMVDTGALTPQRRTDAEWICWSAVHGFADLATRGPLRWQERSTVNRLAAHVVDTVIDDLRTDPVD
ncbi:TetR/AcrR family transcriptional regulator [Streptomyces cahuitamycinicus]|uniref:TetR family transcriptional regulator n=1 Tax=Streptomyces cahuitamycinicus TaxID=2070367 RepID=A0A2N8TXS7_9ACTN|nr:TetR/AcrR family transcriptional regulator [Streptomyces cahuitamycinicus]PNG23817.1 TetR family transcriptional regulator [Streptomyces cahuitamycinicus]